MPKTVKREREYSNNYRSDASSLLAYVDDTGQSVYFDKLGVLTDSLLDEGHPIVSLEELTFWFNEIWGISKERVPFRQHEVLRALHMMRYRVLRRSKDLPDEAKGMNRLATRHYRYEIGRRLDHNPVYEGFEYGRPVEPMDAKGGWPVKRIRDRLAGLVERYGSQPLVFMLIRYRQDFKEEPVTYSRMRLAILGDERLQLETSRYKSRMVEYVDDRTKGLALVRRVARACHKLDWPQPFSALYEALEAKRQFPVTVYKFGRILNRAGFSSERRWNPKIRRTEAYYTPQPGGPLQFEIDLLNGSRHLIDIPDETLPHPAVVQVKDLEGGVTESKFMPAPEPSGRAANDVTAGVYAVD